MPVKPESVTCQPAREPIAVVGMGCRFAGADGPDALWQSLVAGVDAVTEVPKDRFDIDALHDERPAVPGRSVTRWGSFIDPLRSFDVGYFSLSPREAARMDPQQRVLLEVAAETLDDACLSERALRELRTGVFVGACYGDWETSLLGSLERIDSHAPTGATRCALSGRISFAFNLLGPSVTVDAGCASALMSIHLACQSLWSGETQLALAGGVNLLLVPGWTIAFSHAGTLSPDGRCKTFDARANGFVRADGCGLVALMPLSRARQLGLPVHALVRGSAASNDGSTNGLLALPSAVGQENALRAAYASAGLSPHDVQYVEAHGTGTAAGDPVEIAALSAVMRGRAEPCLVGSIKTNIGHTEGAAGVAGFIKTCLALRHREIPGSLHFNQPNPNIAWDGSVKVAAELTSWPEGRARAGVSSFAISGTNVHVVLEEQPPAAPAEPAAAAQPHVLCLSSASEEGLTATAARYAEWLAHEGGAPGFAQVCRTAALGRRHQMHRLALVASDAAEASARLAAFARGTAVPELVQGRARARVRGPVFVYSGQGSQWPGMAAQLLAREPAFASALEDCDRALRPHAGFSVLELLARRSDLQQQPMDVIQPLLFAIQVALSAWFRASGVEPGLVVGHSLGEVAAAQAAGILTLDDAARLVCSRSQRLERTSGQGAMLAVELSFDEAREVCTGYGGAISVAVSNSPTSTVLTGDAERLRELKDALEQRDVFCRVVAVVAAAHSPLLDPLLPDFRRELEGIRPNAASSTPICSTVTAGLLPAAAFDADYWVRNLREPVRFSAAIEWLLAEGYDTFVEISPHPILLGAIQQLAAHTGRSGDVVASLRREEDEPATLRLALGQLYALGQHADLPTWFEGAREFVKLPAYVWQREPLDTAGAAESDGASELAGSHVPAGGLLGPRVESAVHAHTHLFASALSLSRLPYLADHRVRDAALLPGAAYLDMSLAALREVFGAEPFALESLQLQQALPLSASDTNLQLVLSIEPRGASLKFFTKADASDTWSPLATASARRLEAQAELGALEPSAIAAELEVSDVAEHHRAARAHGIDYGPAFRGIRALWLGEDRALAQVSLPASVPLDGGQVAHTALLDACWQALAAVLFRAGSRDGRADAYLPVAVASVHQRRALGAQIWAYARLRAASRNDRPGRICGDLQLCDGTGEVLMVIEGLELQRLAEGESASLDEWLYEPRWVQAQRSEAAQPPQRSEAAQPPREHSDQTWLIFADRRGKIASRIVRRLSAGGARCVSAFTGRGFEAIEPDLFNLDPNEPEHFARLVSEIGGPLAGVVFAWPLDAVSREDAPRSAQEYERALVLGCSSATHLVQALAGQKEPALWLVTQGAQAALADDVVDPGQAPLWAFARVLRYEAPELRTRCIDLSRQPDEAELEALADSVLAPDDEDQIALRNGERRALRLVRGLSRAPERGSSEASGGEVPPFQVDMDRPGILDHLELRAARRCSPSEGEIEIEVRAAALNFLDVMKALNSYPGQNPNEVAFGMECAGRISALGAGVSGFSIGQEVVAAVQLDSVGIGRFVRTSAKLAARKPPHLTFEQATTIPAAFLSAYYSLHHVGRLVAGERVLVHSGTGGVGLAAVQLVRAAGGVLYATAGTEEKRSLLRELGAVHVADSRGLGFAADIRAATGGEGVDIVLNSLAGDAIPLGLSLLRPHGRFVEIGKRDVYQNLQLGLAHFKPALSFSHVDIARMIRDQPDFIGDMLRELMQRVERGELEPLPASVFPVSQAAAAFRFMAQAKHIGKVVLSFDDPALPAAIRPSPKLLLSGEDGRYLISGGLGSLGLATAAWLVEQGARRLVLLGRGAPNPAAVAAIDALRAAGAEVLVRACDVADAAQVAALMSELKRAGSPLRGVVHAAGVLDDGLIASLGAESFARVMRPKLHGAFNLHEQTRGEPLDFFVLYSSVAATLGSPGQANYAAANEFMEALARNRRSAGLPALSIAWGPWSEAGLAARADRGERLGERGLGSLTNAEGLALLGRLLASGASNAAVFPATDWQRWAEFYPAAARSPMLQALVSEASAPARARGGEASELAQLWAAQPSARPQRLESYLLEQVRRVLRIASGKRLDPQLSLTRLGIDSLMALELRNRIEADLNVLVPVSKILLGPSAQKLALDILGSLSFDGIEPPAATAATSEQSQVDGMSDADVDALLGQLLDAGAPEASGGTSA